MYNRILKKIVSSQLTITPKDTKQENFTLALVDYLAKDFRNKGLNVTKNNSYVKIQLNEPYLDKYVAVIVDCTNGYLYLRDVHNQDKKWGKLSKFNPNRASDAYHCANYNVTRIINRVNKLSQNDEQEEEYKETLAQRISKHLYRKGDYLRKNQRVLNVLDLRRDKILDLRQDEILDLRRVANKNCKKHYKVLDLRTTQHKNIFAYLQDKLFRKSKSICNRIIASIVKCLG